MQRLSQGHDLHCNCEDDDSSSESHQAHHPHHYHTQTCFPSRPDFLWKVIFLDKVSTTVSAFELVFFFFFSSSFTIAATFVLWIFSEAKSERNILTPPFALSWEWRWGRGLESRQPGPAKALIACGQIGFQTPWKALTTHFWPLICCFAWLF